MTTRLCVIAALGVFAAFAQQLRFLVLVPSLVEERIGAVRSGNVEREHILHGFFEEAGCSADRLVEQKVGGAKAPNVICTLPGQGTKTIIVGAHFDAVSAGMGAVDNWSGASLLPSLYQGLVGAPRRHKFVFVGFTDEEKGLVGSQSYLGKIKKEERGQISAMVNMDCLGVGPTAVEEERADKRLVEALLFMSERLKLPANIINVHQVGRSDSDTFQDKKIPTVMIHSVTQETLPLLHTAKDQMAAIHLNEYYDSYHLIQAYLAYLDLVLDPEKIE